MLEKALSISVAAYNVEETLGRCLESCTDPRVIDDLEIIVVIDGATDGSAGIAHAFEKTYPSSFRVIEKENGGYGTTVNASMNVASGTYFRLLDGDDWFDGEGLCELVDYCREGTVDWIYSDRVIERHGKSEVDHPGDPGLCRKTIVDPSEMSRFFPGMWMSTFRTSIMKEHPFALPASCLYTDALFVAHHLPFVESMIYLDAPLYHYSIEQDDSQSTGRDQVLKHVEDNYTVWDEMLSATLSACGEAPSPIMMRRLRISYWTAFARTLMQPYSSSAKDRLVALEEDLLRRAPSIYARMNEIGTVRLFRVSPRLGYFILKKTKYRDR